MNAPTPPWGGRFQETPDALLRRFSESVSFDRRLYRHDIRGSIAHATMLREAGLLSAEEEEEIVSGLRAIEEEIATGVFRWSTDWEDLHMNIERALITRTPAGAKLHTGRSRNDQIATALRLWLKEEIDSDREAVRALQRALVDWAERDCDVLLPGYTHLQRAQPVLLAHHLLAYVEMLSRDSDRLFESRRRTDVLPLGSGALAGSTLPLDRRRVAELLDFSDVAHNSMDAVSDRDFVVEYLSALALLGVHLSRFAEDLILWSTSEFGFVSLPEAFTTGSSLMPQKKNPDSLELVRGKAARLSGNLLSLLVLLKGLPLTYNRDLQEDKEPLFDSADTILGCLRILAALIPGIVVHRDRCEQAASDPGLLATDLVDWLVEHGMPFREAHHAVGRLIAFSESKNVPLSRLSAEEIAPVHPDLPEAWPLLWNPRAALERRQTEGSCRPTFVRKEIERWRRELHSEAS
ncbi:argininosuccinate lyase [Methylacidimicrobium cyclopophantes]|uniref:Argininosuccinate lyase n=1 Tax=Methylacidimicrobium cyclopophantes TaxID=1041766 RepID=A0A5E6M736_9BACT|nr:argininosuccinate lyase [Methylacidimicrobium cyclopophantes]VVM05121.1 argininosuccinate lyase [Methylacidimicrobium cyclopophantes]